MKGRRKGGGAGRKHHGERQRRRLTIRRLELELERAEPHDLRCLTLPGLASDDTRGSSRMSWKMASFSSSKPWEVVGLQTP